MHKTSKVHCFVVAAAVSEKDQHKLLLVPCRVSRPVRLQQRMASYAKDQRSACAVHALLLCCQHGCDAHALWGA
jgi:hypothetical protein